jgi:hypothetical protein
MGAQAPDDIRSGDATVRLCRLTAILAMLGLSIGAGGGCLSLSMLNRENADTQKRIDSLEQRVTALEAGAASRPGQPAFVPGEFPGTSIDRRAR